MTSPADDMDNSHLPEALERLLGDGREALVSELSTKLDVEAGLAAIVGDSTAERGASSPATGSAPHRRKSAPHRRKVRVADRNGAAGPPTGPLRYSDRDRKRDYRRGRADARRYLPLVPQQPLPVSRTPFLNELFNLRNQDLAALYARYLNERNPLSDALREADGKRQELLMEQAIAQARLEKLGQPLTEKEATRFTFGEKKAGHPEELIRRRRAREQEQERQTAQKLLEGINGKLRDVAVAVDKAQGALATKLSEAQAAGMEIVSYYEQRTASYLDGLAHTHRRNVELLERLALTDPKLPE